MKRLLLMMIPVVLIILAFRPGRSSTVSGTVTDNSGAAIAGVSVQVKGTAAGTSTDAKGTYLLTLPAKASTLIFSSVGYKTLEVPIAGRPVVNVVLQSTTTNVSDSVVMNMKRAMNNETKVMYESSPMGYNNKSMPPKIAMDGIVEESEIFNTEGYDNITENRFFKTTDNPLSTFSIDVDAASYSNVRRYLNQGQLPPAGA
ncbi:MAG TPA: von Willebrand factor type A domain-containing protein, partial [Chitinophagaceae bacterium]|nr:von Willebrand factor type A domain-containing protein [Chitinophagaceae bacterium]